jgi:CheY-like chemotaxis protein
VQDTGHGMTPEVTEHLFEPFFTTKGVGEGTGLGLAVVHGIVTNHSGAITVVSTPCQGTTFTIYLPRIDTSAATAEPTETSVPEGRERILFIEDEARLAMLWQTVLTRLGYEVVTYTDSVEALQAFRAAPECFDLVITDHSMPRMTGEVLSYELRRLRQDIPIILCTGLSHMMALEKAQRLGVDDVCLKPLRLRDLSGMIRRVLAGHAVRER